MIRKLLPALALLVAVPAFADNSAVDVVRQTTDKLFNLIQEHRADYEQHPANLEDVVRDILLPKLDENYSGRLVLGRHARELSTSEVRQFANALSDMLIKRYAEQLLEFKSREQMQILPLAGDASDRMTRVKTKVQLQSGQSVPVDYIMHRTDQGWQVFDVVVEGVSYVVTFRTQFNEELNHHSFENVLQRIKSGDIEVADSD